MKRAGIASIERPLSPRGRGLRRLSERSDPRVERARGRSWVRGPRRQARSARALASSIFRVPALLRARAAIAALPLIQLRLSSLTLAKATHPSPARGEGTFYSGFGGVGRS